MEKIYNEGASYTSVGLFDTNWTYSGIKNITYQQFYDRQLKFWSIVSKFSNLINNSPITTIPFISFMNIGQGQKYFINGELVNTNNWNDFGQQDFIPYLFEPQLDFYGSTSREFCFDDAFHGGSSVKFLGTQNKNGIFITDLYYTNLKMEENLCFNIYLKIITDPKLYMVLILHFDSGSQQRCLITNKTTNKWIKHTFKIENNFGILNRISLSFSSGSDGENNFEFLLGGIEVTKITIPKPSEPQNLKIVSHSEDNNKLNVNISWDFDIINWYYYIYKESDKIEFIGRTCNNIYHVANLDKNNIKYLIIKSVSKFGMESDGVKLNLSPKV